MVIYINRQEFTVDTTSDVYRISDLLKYLEIDFRVIVEKNGEAADKTAEIVEGDEIRIMRFAAGG
jgi:sulfur carrier protein ThiS